MRIAPVYASWWVELLAIAYRDNGDNGQSISAAKDALLLNADSIGARTVLASALVAGGWLDIARDMVSSILDMDSNFSLAAYAKQHPYRNPARLDSILSDLSDAGLPD